MKNDSFSTKGWKEIDDEYKREKKFKKKEKKKRVN